MVIGTNAREPISVFQATYVDDEMLTLSDKMPTRLDNKLGLLLHTLLRTFGEFRLSLNLGAGKTERKLKYVRNKAGICLQNRRRHDGSLDVALPAAARENM